MPNALHLTDSQWRVLRRVLASDTFQKELGAENWDLTEVEEQALWDIINQSERLGPLEATTP